MNFMGKFSSVMQRDSSLSPQRKKAPLCFKNNGVWILIKKSTALYLLLSQKTSIHVPKQC